MTKHLRSKFDEAAIRFAEKIAIRYRKGEEWTDLSYREMADRIKSLSVFLISRGVRDGDRVGVFMENRPEWPLLFCSTVFTGSVFVPLSPRSQQKEVKNILNDSGCGLVFASETSQAAIEGIRQECPSIK